MGTWKPVSGIYIIRNLTNGKVYIGASVSIKRRWAKHRNRLRSGKHNNAYLQEDWNLAAHLDYAILELCTKDRFVERESYWIKFFDAINPEKGYNSVLPENTKICRKEVIENRKNKYCNVHVCVNAVSGDIVERTTREIKDDLGVKVDYLNRVTSYWKIGIRLGNSKVAKSHKNWIFVLKEDYDPTFNYKAALELCSVKYPKKKKAPVPRTYENIQRTAVRLEDSKTGEVLEYKSITEAVTALKLTVTKVRKCLDAPFGKYAHHGYWMKRL